MNLRPVIAIAPNGTVKYRFPSISAAAQSVGRAQSSIALACQGHTRFCCGLRWLYAADYVKWADYHYTPRQNRDERGHYRPGFNGNPVMSAEARQRVSAALRVRARALAANPASTFAKGLHSRKAVVHINSRGQVVRRWVSMNAAAHDMQVSHYRLRQSLLRLKPLCGMRLRWEAEITP